LQTVNPGGGVTDGGDTIVFKPLRTNAELVVRYPTASSDVNLEAEESMALEAVTKLQSVKAQQTEKT
jgi:hypothetical protein